MAYSVLWIRPFVFTHWSHPAREDMEPLRVESQRFRDEIGEPVVSVAITDDRSVAPDSATRRELVEATRRMSEIVRTFYTVVAHSGFQATIMRSVLAGMFLVHRGPVRPRVARSIDDVLDREAGHFVVPRSEILRRLREEGLITG